MNATAQRTIDRGDGFGTVSSLSDALHMHRVSVANRRAAIGFALSLFVSWAVKATAEEASLLDARARLLTKKEATETLAGPVA